MKEERRALAGALLEGLDVVDLTRALAGPHATMMLADLGARVIKLETPRGDDSRQWGPPFVGADAVLTHYPSCNRNKESVTADLLPESGRPPALLVARPLIETHANRSLGKDVPASSPIKANPSVVAT